MAIERVALAGAFAASLVAWPHLPSKIPPLWRVRGEWVFIGKPFVAFLLPVAAAIIWSLFASLRATTRDADTPRAWDIGALTALFLSAFHVTMLIAFVGSRLWVVQLLGLMAGLFLVTTGNDLPRVRPNLLWGIRTAQTLDREDVWRRVHRLGGFIRVTMGLLVCLVSLVGLRGIAELIFFAVLIETVTCIGAGLFLSRRHA
jgi:immunity protein, SdpI family